MEGNDRVKGVIDTVQVALRIRPLVDSEIARGCEECVEVVSGEPQVHVKELAFTFNYVFPPHINQQEFYDTAVKNLISKLFEGYNVTILAYGQTGSGKTYSMGTNYTGCEGDGDRLGIIPQAVRDIFDYIESHEEDFIFKVSVSFMELYQEQCYDLLSDKPRAHSVVDIREDHRGVILPGLTEIEVQSSLETMLCLTRGSEGRAVGATAMNTASSRSHAIFTILIAAESRHDKNQATTSKFHLVDLAGSERAKKTQASGDRFKEGVKINQGLLALGNVISALGDGTNRGYICYRESKLTRLLQDSLGGNSLTLMIACVSPADYNLEETVSTLRYADRARRIKNKPIVNQDAKAAEIVRLNNLVNELRLQLVGRGGGESASASSGAGSARGAGRDDAEWAERLEAERAKYAELLRKHKHLTDMLSGVINENTSLCEKALLAEAAKEKMERKLNELTEKCNLTLEKFSLAEESGDESRNLVEYIRDMKERLEDLKSVQTKCNEEIIQFDLKDEMGENGHENGHENGNGDGDGNGNGDGDDNYANGDDSAGENRADDDTMLKQEEHALDQVRLNKQVQALNREMAIKKCVVKKMMENTERLLSDDKSYRENEAKINALEKEKDELMQQLKNAQHKNPLNDERKTKVAALEAQIQSLKKKCQEQANIIKIKERNEAKIAALNSEIQNMKFAKVSLIKRMRCESERFRKWRLESERDVCRLRAQERRQASTIARMESAHGKQQAVLKRKMAEAVAINKRLKEALERQKVCQAKRHKSRDKAEAVQQWLEQELDIQLSTVEAQRTLLDLMEHRGMIMAEIERLKECEEAGAEGRVRELEDDLALRKAQISDLQQKIISADQENKSRTRFDNVATMVEAKVALKLLFEQAVEARRAAGLHARRDLERQHAELLQRHKRAQHELELARRTHEGKLAALAADFEDKVAALMQSGQACDGTDRETKEHLDYQMRLIDQLREENERLKQEIESSRKPKKTKSASERKINYVELEPDSGDESDSYESDKDPEWRKTPLRKRTQMQLSRMTMNFTEMRRQEDRKKEEVKEKENKDKDKEKENKEIGRAGSGTKRGSDGAPHCACKGSCSTKLCGCNKANAGCRAQCKCSAGLCKNRRSCSDTEERDHDPAPAPAPARDRTHILALANSVNNASPADETRTLYESSVPHDTTFIMSTKKKRYFYDTEPAAQ